MAALGACHMCMHAQALPRRRSFWVSAAAGKGFGGKTPAQKHPAKEKKKRPARRGPQKLNQFIEDEERRQQEPAGRGGPAGVEQRPQTPRERELAERYRNAGSAQQSGQSGSTNSDFERKLSQLTEQRRDDGEKQEEEQESLDVLALEPQFGRPEPKQQGTRLGKEEPKDEGGFMTSGPAKAASLAGAIVLVVIFLVSSVGLDSGSGPPATDEQAAKLGEQQYKQVEAQAARFEEQLRSSPNDIEALEGAAVAYTKLGDLEKATTYLVQLSKGKPDDPQVFRLLAETQAFQGEVKAAVATYQTAVAKTKGRDVDLVSGLADVLVDDGKPQQAVEAVKEARKSSGSDADLGLDLDLVLARTFAKWKGHDSEALAIYERLAETSSDDFRIPLAKGLLMKGEGRKGDAQRAFMKARYLAPSGAREAVDSLIARQ